MRIWILFALDERIKLERGLFYSDVHLKVMLISIQIWPFLLIAVTAGDSNTQNAEISNKIRVHCIRRAQACVKIPWNTSPNSWNWINAPIVSFVYEVTLGKFCIFDVVLKDFLKRKTVRAETLRRRLWGAADFLIPWLSCSHRLSPPLILFPSRCEFLPTPNPSTTFCSLCHVPMEQPREGTPIHYSQEIGGQPKWGLNTVTQKHHYRHGWALW